MTGPEGITSFAGASPAREEGAVDAAKVIEGAPRTVTENIYTDRAERVYSGYWSSGPGKWRVNYEEEEFCHLLEGVIELADEAGNAVRFAAGDSFVISAGFKGTWETIEPCRKIYVIILPAQ